MSWCSLALSGMNASSRRCGLIRAERAAASTRPSRPIDVGWAPKALLASVLGLLVAQYLASFFFLYSIHLDTRRATPLTILRYAAYYGDRPGVRRRLMLASGGGVCVVFLCGLIVLAPKRRSLHGDARFARRPEIARAGLFARHGLFLGRMGRRYLI